MVAPMDCAALRECCAVMLRRVELTGLRKDSPAMRAARVLDRAASGGRVVQRHPAGGESGGDHPFAVAVVLMEAERFRARRLPDDVVLTDAGAAPAGQRAQMRPISSLSTIRAIVRSDFQPFNLASTIGRVAPVTPIPFIRIEAGLELTSKQRFEAAARTLDSSRGEALDNEEPVGSELFDLSRRDRKHVPTAPSAAYRQRAVARPSADCRLPDAGTQS